MSAGGIRAAICGSLPVASEGDVPGSWQFPDYATGDYGTGYSDGGERGESYMEALLRHVARALSGLDKLEA
jgi:hypothetical protein